MSGGLGISLSGGGVLGAVHLGVLKALGEWGIAPAVCVGASAGGLVAGALGAGLTLPEVTAFFQHVCASPAWYELEAAGAEELSALRTGNRLGATTLAPALSTLVAHAPRVLVSDWMPGYAVVTVDLGKGALLTLCSTAADAERWGTEIALQATSAFPGLFAGVEEPVDHPTSLYVDGGLQDDTPVDAAFALGATAVISVTTGAGAGSALPPLPAKVGILDVFRRAIGYTTGLLNAASNPPKGPVFLLAPTLPTDAGLLSFGDFPVLVQAGYAAAVAQEAAIKAFIAENVAAPTAPEPTPAATPTA